MRLLAVLLLAAGCGGGGSTFASTSTSQGCAVYIEDASNPGNYYYVPGFTVLTGFDAEDTPIYRRFEDEWGFVVEDDGANGPVDVLIDEWLYYHGDPACLSYMPVTVDEFEDFEVFLYDFSAGEFIGPADYRRWLRDHKSAEYVERE
ncbi:MAG TPA: hypothetical protein VFY93_10405 [Planctomycetota bacterium]|nr:hypothetical protein [Planctomycetota bacterium]